MPILKNKIHTYHHKTMFVDELLLHVELMCLYLYYKYSTIYTTNNGCFFTIIIITTYNCTFSVINGTDCNNKNK